MLNSLHDMLLAQTALYLDLDNPMPKSTLQSMFKYFDTGRKRAEEYRKNVLEPFYGEHLLHEVYLDLIKVQPRLGTSSQYRRRLMEGVCQSEFIGLTLDYIDRKAMKRNDSYAEMNMYGVPMPDYNILRDDIMENIISARMKAITNLAAKNTPAFSAS